MGGRNRKRKRNNGNSVGENAIVARDFEEKENCIVGSSRVGTDGGKDDGVRTDEKLVTVFKKSKRGKGEDNEKMVVAWGGRVKERLKSEQLDNPSCWSPRLRPRKEAYAYRKLQLGVESDFIRIVGRRVKVYWPLDRKWYAGHVVSFEHDKKIHQIRYDDGEEEWLVLENEKFEVEVLKGEVSGNRFICNPETVDDNLKEGDNSVETRTKTEICANDDNSNSEEGHERQQSAIDVPGNEEETGSAKVVAAVEEGNEREHVVSTDKSNGKQKNEIELGKFVGNVERGNEKERGTGTVKDETDFEDGNEREHNHPRENNDVEERNDKVDESIKFGGSVVIGYRNMKQKNRKRKRDKSRHSFRKVELNERDYERILGRRIKVYWPLDRKWYIARVVSFDGTSKRHHILYEDGDTENLHLCNERFELEIAAGEAFGKQRRLVVASEKNEKEADFHSHSERKNEETIKMLSSESTNTDSSMSKTKFRLEEADESPSKGIENEVGVFNLLNEDLMKSGPSEEQGNISEAQIANILNKENKDNLVTNTKPTAEVRDSLGEKAIATNRSVLHSGSNASNKQAKSAQVFGQHGPGQVNELVVQHSLYTSETELGSSLLMTTKFHENGPDDTETSKEKPMQEISSMKNLGALKSPFFVVFGRTEHLDFDKQSETETSGSIKDRLTVSESHDFMFGEEHGSGEKVNELATELAANNNEVEVDNSGLTTKRIDFAVGPLAEDTIQGRNYLKMQEVSKMPLLDMLDKDEIQKTVTKVNPVGEKGTSVHAEEPATILTAFFKHEMDRKRQVDTEENSEKLDAVTMTEEKIQVLEVTMDQGERSDSAEEKDGEKLLQH
ncbi:sister chromatid cohesion protein PDS5 homolog E-like [Nymphaea colorata]|nr:sister chromatid cohesion protein PDS5 homolog E-like [Nymphaea colorata]XP_031494644.1 sister chromatid cohesion protein PDS5 homolog E-like [Nymphaea colorata]